MDKRIINARPDIYELAKPYIKYLESLGFYQDLNFKYFDPKDKEFHHYFNHWKYKTGQKKYGYNNDDYVCDLISYTYELKVEVYTFKTVKTKYLNGEQNIEQHLEYQNKCVMGEYESVIVKDFKQFKKEIQKYLKGLKLYHSKVRKNDLEKDFTETN